MKAAEQETRQVPSAVLQTFRLKINIVAYGGVAGMTFGSYSQKCKSYI